MCHFVSADALHPRRPPTEEAFWKMGHHEKATDEKIMQDKIKVIKERRKMKDWDPNHPMVKKAISLYGSNSTTIFGGIITSSKKRPPNILLMLADDLGYGDLSVQPFTHDGGSNWPCSEGGILTPNLERMAAKGAIMTNFHSASPVCSPSRVAVMTGLYPWRLDALNAFELGQDLSQRNGFLPQVRPRFWVS